MASSARHLLAGLGLDHLVAVGGEDCLHQPAVGGEVVDDEDDGSRRLGGHRLFRRWVRTWSGNVWTLIGFSRNPSKPADRARSRSIDMADAVRATTGTCGCRGWPAAGPAPRGRRCRAAGDP